MSRPDQPTSPVSALTAAIVELVRAEVDRRVSAALAERPAATAYLSTAAAAAHAEVAPGTIRRWIREGRLVEHRAGRELRVSRAELEQLLGRGIRAPGPGRELTPEQLAARRFGVG